MNPIDRLPFAIRLMWPRLARTVALLAAEPRPAEPLDPDRRTQLELAVESFAIGDADRLMARRARRIRRVAGAGSAAADAARTGFVEVRRSDDLTVQVDGRAMTVGSLRTLAATAVGERRSRLLRWVGVALLLVDAAALVIIFGYLVNIDWTRPDPANLTTVLALSVFGAAVQAVLAAHLGKRLWAWRHLSEPLEFPPRALVVVLAGGLLMAVSALAAAALFLRVQREGLAAEAGELATALGLLLAFSAVAAPWCLVADEAYSPAPAARFAAAAARALVRADRRRDCRAWQARLDLRAADRCRLRAERLLDTARSKAGRRYLPAHRAILTARAMAGEYRTIGAAELASSGEIRAVLPLLVPDDHRMLAGILDHLRAAIGAARAEDDGVRRRELEVAA